MEDDDETFDCTDDAYKNAVQWRNHAQVSLTKNFQICKKVLSDSALSNLICGCICGCEK